MNALKKYHLSPKEIRQFHDQGFLGPYALCTPDEMNVIRERIDQEVLPTAGLSGKGAHRSAQSRHLDCRVVYDLCSHPAIIRRMACLYGEDLVLWRSHFFTKEPGGKEIPWHQDLNYWPLEPVVNISAWLAIDEATVENSCVQLIPGSHKKSLPHIRSSEGMQFSEMTDPAHVDASKAINMELKPGEFFLFNEKTLHHSEPNRSNRRRLGLAVRVTVPFVKVYHEQLFENHKVIIVSGEDRLGFNQVGSPPAEKLHSCEERACETAVV